jgi:prophage tail gpP-like protein
MARPRDRVTIEGDAGVFDRFTSVEVTNDLTAPAEASFECGDDASWASMEDRIVPGTEYQVYLNQRLRLTGRVQVNDVPIDAQGGATVRFVVRTKLADAAYASALASISVQNATLKDIVLRAYGPLGFKETDFVFKSDVARDLMTGRNSRGGDPRVDLEPLKLEQAKVNPPETIYDFVERHLLRFHLSHWDSPDGKIVVGAPNDQQRPLYDFRLKKGSLGGRHNNLLSAHRTRDVSDAPTSITIFNTVGPEIARYRIASTVRPSLRDLNPQRFYRPVVIPDQSVQTRDQVVAKAQRELLNRSKKLDAWEVTTDGWSFWDGTALIPYGIDTVADLTIDVAGGSVGTYLVHQTRLRLDPENGYTASLTLLRSGLWVL